ncbi:uncharacterized protein N7511_009308 [Penicillium nucicola]|uniref:uncharacterized protein n=1 Tax=Penicillium nucicola TaxID=1850975 RepID=UPI002544F194|nr:uncharacterized protein N7511_009308 [Penicillium nucicola]KAJ5747612.1 hypothetical protein N7511_009308 [Penicillium nucicola]
MEHARDLQFPIGVDFRPEQLQASIDPVHSARPTLQFHDRADNPNPPTPPTSPDTSTHLQNGRPPPGSQPPRQADAIPPTANPNVPPNNPNLNPLQLLVVLPRGPNKNRLSPSATPSTQAATETATETPSKKPSDFDDILDRLDLNPTQTPQRSRRVFSDTLSRAVGQGAMGRGRRGGIPPQRKIDLKLGPSLGRQAIVEPERGQDLASALRRLNTTIVQNKLRQTANAQRFHTRKGMVAKQKKMVRWKRLFKVSFQSTVQKIQRMQTQGW